MEPAASGKEAIMHSKDYETMIQMVKVAHVTPEKERELLFFLDNLQLTPWERLEINAQILQKFTCV